jgi:hypothetical protein
MKRLLWGLWVVGYRSYSTLPIAEVATKEA